MSGNTLKEQGALLGVSLNSIYRWEHDLALPRKSKLKKIADLYEVSVEWLLLESEPEEMLKQKEDIVHLEHYREYQLLQYFRKLTEQDRFRILGYIERLSIEGSNEQYINESKVAWSGRGIGISRRA